MFTWLPMFHLPSVPEHFVHTAQRLLKERPPGDSNFVKNIDNFDSYKNRTLVKDHYETSSRTQRGLAMPDEWHAWVRQNIVKDYLESDLRVSEGNSTVHGAHCDFRRKWKLYYLLDRGGDSATTYFYQQKGYPIVREEITDSDTTLITCNNYQELTVIDQVQWPLHKWVLLNTMILHGVDGVTGNRANFTISIRPNYELIFC
jgi:hypothetical protein